MLQHVWTRMDEFLFADGRHWTLETASAAESVCLLDLLKRLEWSDLNGSFRSKRFDAAIETAVQTGRIQVLEWWLTRYMPERARTAIPRMLQFACKWHRVDVLQWMHQQGRFDMLVGRVDVVCASREIADWVFEHLNHMTIAAYSVNFRTKDWFALFKLGLHRNVELRLNCLFRTFADKAAADGHLEALQWMLTHADCKCSSAALDWAVSHGRLEMVQWLYRNLPRGYFDKLTRGCNEHDTIDWVLSNYEWIDPDEKKNWIAKCIHRSRYGWKGRWDMFERLVVACPDADNGEAMEIVALRGELQLVRRLHACGAKSTPNAMDEAAFGGHLPVLRWLHEFREEGCTKAAVNDAAERGHLEVIRWLHQHKSQYSTTEAMDSAARGGHRELLEWLHWNRTEGCTTEAMDSAARSGNAKTVEWLHDNRTEGCSAKAIVVARDLGILKYLCQHYPPVDESLNSATYIAALNGQLRTVQFWTSRYQICLVPLQISRIIGRRSFAEAEWLLKDAAHVQ